MSQGAETLRLCCSCSCAGLRRTMPDGTSQATGQYTNFHREKTTTTLLTKRTTHFVPCLCCGLVFTVVNEITAADTL